MEYKILDENDIDVIKQYQGNGYGTKLMVFKKLFYTNSVVRRIDERITQLIL